MPNLFSLGRIPLLFPTILIILSLSACGGSEQQALLENDDPIVAPSAKPPKKSYNAPVDSDPLHLPLSGHSPREANDALAEDVKDQKTSAGYPASEIDTIDQESEGIKNPTIHAIVNTPGAKRPLTNELDKPVEVELEPEKTEKKAMIQDPPLPSPKVMLVPDANKTPPSKSDQVISQPQHKDAQLSKSIPKPNGSEPKKVEAKPSSAAEKPQGPEVSKSDKKKK